MQQSDDSIDEVQALNSACLTSRCFLLSYTIESFRMHGDSYRVDPSELIEDCHEFLQESFHTVAILLADFLHQEVAELFKRDNLGTILGRIRCYFVYF